MSLYGSYDRPRNPLETVSRRGINGASPGSNANIITQAGGLYTPTGSFTESLQVRKPRRYDSHYYSHICDERSLSAQSFVSKYSISSDAHAAARFRTIPFQKQLLKSDWYEKNGCCVQCGKQRGQFAVCESCFQSTHLDCCHVRSELVDMQVNVLLLYTTHRPSRLEQIIREGPYIGSIASLSYSHTDQTRLTPVILRSYNCIILYNPTSDSKKWKNPDKLGDLLYDYIRAGHGGLIYINTHPKAFPTGKLRRKFYLPLVPKTPSRGLSDHKVKAGNRTSMSHSSAAKASLEDEKPPGTLVINDTLARYHPLFIDVDWLMAYTPLHNHIRSDSHTENHDSAPNYSPGYYEAPLNRRATSLINLGNDLPLIVCMDKHMPLGEKSRIIYLNYDLDYKPTDSTHLAHLSTTSPIIPTTETPSDQHFQGLDDKYPDLARLSLANRMRLSSDQQQQQQLVHSYSMLNLGTGSTNLLGIDADAYVQEQQSRLFDKTVLLNSISLVAQPVYLSQSQLYVCIYCENNLQTPVPKQLHPHAPSATSQVVATQAPKQQSTQVEMMKRLVLDQYRLERSQRDQTQKVHAASVYRIQK